MLFYATKIMIVIILLLPRRQHAYALRTWRANRLAGNDARYG